MFSRFLCFFILAGCARAEYVSDPVGPIVPPSKATCENRCDHRVASGSCVEIVWEKIPVKKDFGQFVVKITRVSAYDQMVTLAEAQQVEAFLWMPSMGHGSSPMKIEKIDTGIYRVSKVFFSMPGDWDIHLKVLWADKAADDLVLPYRF